MSSERHGPRSTARLAEPSAHRRTPAPNAPEAPTKPPQRAKIYALTAGAACGAAEVCPRPYAVKQRETSGLAGSRRPCPRLAVNRIRPLFERGGKALERVV